MNKGYTYEEKIIKSNVSDSEYAFVSENNNLLNGFNTKIDWERVYPYGDTFKSILEKSNFSDSILDNFNSSNSFCDILCCFTLSFSKSVTSLSHSFLFKRI